MKEYKNPIIANEQEGINKGDPYVLFYGGFYYHCYSTEEGIFLGRAKELCDIGKGERFKVFDVKSSGRGGWFAPELHRIDNKWYIYTAPEYEDRLHMMTVLEYDGDTPVGNYKNLGIVKGLEGLWTIDGTVLEHNGKRYFVYARYENICMTELENPWTVTGETITLTKPEYEFETKVAFLNEGPAVLKRGNKIHIAYSANDSNCDEYCLGLLTYSGNGDIMDINNWEKSKNAVFEKTDKIYGPGHCSFTKVEEGAELVDYIVYHANLISGSGWNGRNVFIQSIEWDENDMPIFGEPRF